MNNKYSHFNYLTHWQCNIKNQYVYHWQTLLFFDEQVGIKILPQTVKLIRSLGLQRKWKHKQSGKRAGRNRGKVTKQTGINIDNIIQIKCIPTQEFTKNVGFFTANCRSALKSGRDTQVRNFMVEKKHWFWSSNWNMVPRCHWKLEIVWHEHTPSKTRYS